MNKLVIYGDVLNAIDIYVNFSKWRSQLNMIVVGILPHHIHLIKV